VECLGHGLFSEGIKVHPKKVETLQSWPRPSSTIEIGSFLSIIGYYQCFVEGFSSIAALLTRLTQNGAQFRWPDECEKSFQNLKTVFTIAPVWVLPSTSGSYTVYYDALRICIGCVLM